MRSQRRRTPYSRDSIGRALQHHELTGVISSWSPPYVGRPSWLVTPADGEQVELTTPQVYALALGLAWSETRWKP